MYDVRTYHRTVLLFQHCVLTLQCGDKNRRLTECSMPPNSQKSRKLSSASNGLEQPMSTTNRAFSPATPIYHTYQCHVLFSLCMLDLKMGKGRRVIKYISKSMHTRHYSALLLTQGTRLGIPHCC